MKIIDGNFYIVRDVWFRGEPSGSALYVPAGAVGLEEAKMCCMGELAHALGVSDANICGIGTLASLVSMRDDGAIETTEEEEEAIRLINEITATECANTKVAAIYRVNDSTVMLPIEREGAVKEAILRAIPFIFDVTFVDTMEELPERESDSINTLQDRLTAHL